MIINSGIPGLDVLLRGGLIKGRNILLSGPCGSGKSTFGMQFLYACTKNDEETGLYVTLEEHKDKIIEDMAKLGLDIKEAEKRGKIEIIGGPIAGITHYMEKVDAKLKDILMELEEVVREKKITRIVIDSINLLTMAMRTDDERRIAIASLCNTLSNLGCTSMILSETKEGSMDLSRYGMEEFVVDGVIVLYLVRQGSQFVPGIAVRKMRGINHDKQIRVFQITDTGIVIYPDETMFSGI